MKAKQRSLDPGFVCVESWIIPMSGLSNLAFRTNSATDGSVAASNAHRLNVLESRTPQADFCRCDKNH